MSVLTEFISQARQEDAERRKEEREERRIDRAERKAEAEEQRRNEDRRDENNRMMFQTMMATIMSQTATATASAASPPSTPTNTENANWIVESNKKRNRKNDTIDIETAPITTTQEQFNRMEVEESLDLSHTSTSTGQQNHDVQEKQISPLIQ
jgi:hypothetical protein